MCTGKEGEAKKEQCGGKRKGETIEERIGKIGRERGRGWEREGIKKRKKRVRKKRKRAGDIERGGKKKGKRRKMEGVRNCAGLRNRVREID